MRSAAAAPALIDRVEPNCAIEHDRDTAPVAALGQARALLAEQQHAGRAAARVAPAAPSPAGCRRRPPAAPRAAAHAGELGDVRVVAHVLVAVGHHRAAPVPPPAPDDVHLAGEERVGGAHDRADVEVVLPVLDRDVEVVPSRVEVGDDGLASPVPVAVDDVAPVAVARAARGRSAGRPATAPGHGPDADLLDARRSATAPTLGFDGCPPSTSSRPDARPRQPDGRCGLRRRARLGLRRVGAAGRVSSCPATPSCSRPGWSPPGPGRAVSLPLLAAGAFVAAVAGDSVGYAFGSRLGAAWLVARVAPRPARPAAPATAPSGSTRGGAGSRSSPRGGSRGCARSRRSSPAPAGCPTPRFLSANVVGALALGRRPHGARPPRGLERRRCARVVRRRGGVRRRLARRWVSSAGSDGRRARQAVASQDVGRHTVPGHRDPGTGPRASGCARRRGASWCVLVGGYVALRGHRGRRRHRRRRPASPPRPAPAVHGLGQRGQPQQLLARCLAVGRRPSSTGRHPDHRPPTLAFTVQLPGVHHGAGARRRDAGVEAVQGRREGVVRQEGARRSSTAGRRPCGSSSTASPASRGRRARPRCSPSAGSDGPASVSSRSGPAG